jgi:hypothetical protein
MAAGSLTVTGLGGSGMNKVLNGLPAMAQIRNRTRQGQPETPQAHQPLLTLLTKGLPVVLDHQHIVGPLILH